MIEIEDYTVAQARKSALTVAGVLAVLGGWQLYRGRFVAAMVLGSAAAVPLACAAIPSAAMFFHKWWMRLAAVLGYVNSRIILSALFYLLITPIGVVARLVGHDPLMRRKADETSYWRKRESTRQSRDGYERSF